MWLGKLTTLDMTPLGWLGRKTSTQTNKTISPINRSFEYHNYLLLFVFLYEYAYDSSLGKFIKSVKLSLEWPVRFSDIGQAAETTVYGSQFPPIQTRHSKDNPLSG